MAAAPDIDDLAQLRAEVDGVSAVLARAALSEPVAGCPGWTVRELVEHLGGVHRWATQIVQTGAPQQADEPSGIADLPGWFDEGATELIRTLVASDPEAACWSFTAARTAGFWRRRQALETAVHRWDAERALGEPGPIDSGLAAAGVTEVVELMTPRQVRMGRIPPLVAGLELRATDTGATWQLGESQVASVAATAEQLLLLLWHRIDPADPRVRTDGDRETADAVLRLALAP
ncbi:MAG: hypothetical protein QOE84_2569 [Actinomycetota bacterium]|nr:hypothetical protein [Actinomycetota bacterium]